MKLIDCVAAYKAVHEMMDLEQAYPTAHALLSLKRQLKPHVDFCAVEEMKLVDKYARKGENGIVWGEVGFIFDDPAKAPEYAQKRKELMDVEVEVDKVKLDLATVTPAQLEALEGFME